MTVEIFNGTYLIEVNGTIILVAAGSPTEQDITITALVQIAINLEFDIKILIVAMRTFEKKENFDTPNELNKLATKIFQEKISKIPGNFKNSEQWNNRVDKIVSKVKESVVS
ncbi:hypothetical protein B0A75_11975 [Flavobacterium oncorhynchi]|uniref:Uncharacterized protein n=1 Tax=Flavobacterium oncorhynchi TaxID=728056 RepID=A0A226HYY6_9FLAO|nr:hypothetical protein [Flavobacterium oncorhynchi]OXA99138.1 hypothetical protein B0A75_11975 [Flavobacterium oncorhynchi]